MDYLEAASIAIKSIKELVKLVRTLKHAANECKGLLDELEIVAQLLVRPEYELLGGQIPRDLKLGLEHLNEELSSLYILLESKIIRPGRFKLRNRLRWYWYSDKIKEYSQNVQKAAEGVRSAMTRAI